MLQVISPIFHPFVHCKTHDILPQSLINCCFVWVPKADWQEFAQSTCIPLPMYLVQCTSDCWHVIETEKVQLDILDMYMNIVHLYAPPTFAQCYN